MKSTLIRVLRPAVACALVAVLSPHALAAQSACLLEGEVVLGEKSIPVKDCLENHGVTDDRFRQMCEQVNDIGKATGTSKMSYLDSCPSGSRGSCSTFFGAPIAGYYYLRSDKDLLRTKSACIKQGGAWK